MRNLRAGEPHGGTGRSKFTKRFSFSSCTQDNNFRNVAIDSISGSLGALDERASVLECGQSSAAFVSRIIPLSVKRLIRHKRFSRTFILLRSAAKTEMGSDPNGANLRKLFGGLARHEEPERRRTPTPGSAAPNASQNSFENALKFNAFKEIGNCANASIRRGARASCPHQPASCRRPGETARLRSTAQASGKVPEAAGWKPALPFDSLRVCIFEGALVRIFRCRGRCYFLTGSALKLVPFGADPYPCFIPKRQKTARTPRRWRDHPSPLVSKFRARTRTARSAVPTVTNRRPL